MRAARRVLGLTAVASAVLALAAPSARADADPASDILLSQDVFLPFFGGKASDSTAKYLDKVVKQAKASGFPIKVAVIGARGDLGGVFVLWNKPKRYAPFLGREIAFQYRGRLLVAMPAGFGFAWANHGSAREQRVLARVPVGAGPDRLTRSAAEAVKRLAAADGHTINVQPPSSSSSSATRVVIGVLGGLVLAAIVAAPLLLRRRRSATA